MDFNLTEEQIIFQNTVRNLAENHLSKNNLKRAHDPNFPKFVSLICPRIICVQDVSRYFLIFF